MANQENLKFQISLSGTYWRHRPQYSIWIDDRVAIQSQINDGENTVIFERLLDEGPHSLKIRFENKNSSDTVMENGQIVKDMLLNVDDIIIDDISLGNLLWSAEYILDKPQQYNDQTITKLDNCVNLGWNGTYILNFSSPFYIWLLEKL